MNLQKISIEKVLIAAGIGVVAYLVLFKPKSASGANATAGNLAGTDMRAMPAGVPSGSMRDAQPAMPPAAPVAAGRAFILQQDIRALVAPQTMRMMGVRQGNLTTPPYMAPQQGAGSVRIFSPGEPIITSEIDIQDGYFYAADTETSPRGSIIVTGFKRYYTGSGDKLKAVLNPGNGEQPDFDPYTGQSFSPSGEAIRQALIAGKAALVSGNIEDFVNPASTGFRHAPAPAYSSSRMPPSFARRAR